MHAGSFRRIVAVLWLVLGCPFVPAGAAAAQVQSPVSSGGVAMLDEPVFRIPGTNNPPIIDGVMEDGEWEDASALSGFWYDYGQALFFFLAPVQTQLQVYAMYDDDYLYIAFTSPVYPEGSWLRTRGRFPNVLGHPRYGVLRDDHIELELRPYHDIARGYELGLMKWVINPIDTIVDQYWSPQHAMQWQWESGVEARSTVSDTNWTIEMAIPHEAFIHELYAGYDADGGRIVTIPPPDGTVYRCWLVRGIAGNGPFFNVFDAHRWNTTKTKLIFDSSAVGFQINELGPVMDDIIDVHLTLKNHSSRSESVRLGFFVENAYGLIYTSYEDELLTGGIVELIPGEVRELRLRRSFPGITERGNTLWFDVRTAGSPAKPLLMTRLIDFHAHDKQHWRGTSMSFHEARVNIIETLRPSRVDFDMWFDIWPYNNRLSAVIDRGIHGASGAVQTAAEARVAVVEAGSGDEVASHTGQFAGDFAIVEFDLPELHDERQYELSVLLFDEDRRIVSDRTSSAFNRWKFPSWMIEKDTSGELTEAWIRGMSDPPTPVSEWMNNDVGLGDVVWEPFRPLELTDDGFRTVKHEFTLDESGLPAQIFIKPSARMLPLELRGEGAQPDVAQLLKAGRGPRLAAPMRLEAVADGRRFEVAVTEPARLVRRWDSELVYRSRLEAGPVDIDLKVRYDCDGSMHVTMDYGADSPRQLDMFRLTADIRGEVDLVASGIGDGGGMPGSNIMQCALPPYEGVVWDSTIVERPGLFYSRFVPWIFFGSGDWGLSWMADSDRGWGLDRDGTSMTFERDAGGVLSWHVFFINHPFTLQGRRRIDFTVMTHPAKPKPDGYRKAAWHYRSSWASGYGRRPADLTEEYLESRSWYSEKAPWVRGGRWRNWGTTPAHRISPHIDLLFEERGTYLLARHVSAGRRHGWWWDESAPVSQAKSDDLAAGYAYMRCDDRMEAGELPWQMGYTSGHMRSVHKRLAKVFKMTSVEQRQYHWANAQANMLEGLGWDAQLVEGAGNNHRSFELDMMTIYPMSLYRFLAKPFSGLVTRHAGGETPTMPGDDKRLDRQWVGLPILHDIGVSPDSACGVIQHVEEVLRAIDILDEFGYFDEDGTEFVPYWRNQHIVRWGEGRKRYAPRPELNIREPDEQLYVSVYRRAAEDEDGRRGYKALFVLVNEYREDVVADLSVLLPGRIFGGPNTLMRSEVLDGYRNEFGLTGALLEDWRAQNRNDVPVLIDLEDGSIIELSSTAEGETYGPVHVPRRNFRLLYGHFLQ